MNAKQYARSEVHIKSVTDSWQWVVLQLGGWTLHHKGTDVFWNITWGLMGKHSWVRASRIYSSIYPTRCKFTQFIYIWKLLYMFRVVPPPIIRSAYNYLRYLVFVTPLLLPAAIMEEMELPSLPRYRQVAVTVWQIPDAVDTVVCAPDDGWSYHPKHVEQFPFINKLCKVASCWVYIGI